VFRADDAVLEQGAALQERCWLAFGALDGRKLTHATTDQKATAKGLQRLLKDYGARAGKVSTPTGLAAVTDLAQDPLDRAEQLRAQIEHTRATAETTRREEVRASQDERAERKQRAAWDVQRARSIRSNLKAGLSRVCAEARPLEVLWARKAAKSGERPWVVLSELRINGEPLLSWQQAPAPAPQSGWRVFLPQLPQQGWWVIAGTSSTLPMGALDDWGPGTRDVLRPTLIYLHGIEDNLRLELGLKSAPRKRPDVPSRAIVAQPQRRAIEFR
jgi:hypothetical protein